MPTTSSKWTPRKPSATSCAQQQTGLTFLQSLKSRQVNTGERSIPIFTTLAHEMLFRNNGFFYRQKIFSTKLLKLKAGSEVSSDLGESTLGATLGLNLAGDQRNKASAKFFYQRHLHDFGSLQTQIGFNSSEAKWSNLRVNWLSFHQVLFRVLGLPHSDVAISEARLDLDLARFRFDEADSEYVLERTLDFKQLAVGLRLGHTFLHSSM